MEFPEILVFAIVWGALMIYFLLPFSENNYLKIEENTKSTFLDLLKDSVVKITMHKKAIFAAIMLIITLIYIWSSHSQMEWYTNAHGGELSYNPTQQAVSYMLNVVIYTMILYLFLVIRRTLMLLKKIVN